jgi:hypothetical protein
MSILAALKTRCYVAVLKVEESLDGKENCAAAHDQTMDERGLPEPESALEGEDAGCQNLEGNEADGGSASTEGITPRNWVRAPTLTSGWPALSAPLRL